MGKTTFRDLIYDPDYGGGIRGGRELKAFIPGGASAPWFGPEQLDLPLDQDAVGSRLDARLRRDRRHGRHHRHGAGRLAARALLRPRVVRQVHAVPRGQRAGWRRSCSASRTARAARPTSTCCMDVCDNIAPGLTWPPRQTTICPLGPSIPSPIVSAIRRFRDEFLRPHQGRCLPLWPLSRRARDGDHHRRRPRRSTAGKGELIIAAAERAGVYIPRFCYHPRMKPVGHVPHVPGRGRTGPRAGAARPACLIAGAPTAWRSTPTRRRSRRPRTASSSSCSSTTRSTARCATRAASARCRTRPSPTGPGESRFVEEKRHWEKPIPIRELVLLDRERCILCDRCTRFADEVAGDPLIDFAMRGDDDRGGHLPRRAVRLLLQRQHRADLPGRRPDRRRPTASRPGRGTSSRSRAPAPPARSAAGSRCSRAATGSSATWASTATRSTGAGCATRAASTSRRSTATTGSPRPLVRKGDELVEVGWAEALAAAADGLGKAVERPRRRRPSACIGGARLANEDAYAWAKLARSVLGTDNVDAQLGDGLPAELVLGLPRATIDEACRGRGGRPARARPQGGAARPLPAAPPRGGRGPRCPSSSWPRSAAACRRYAAASPALPARARRPLVAAALVADGRSGRRGRPAWRRPSIVGRPPAARRHGKRTARMPTSSSCSAARRWPSRGALVAEAAAALLAGLPGVRVPARPAAGQRPRRPRHGPGARRAARPGRPRRRAGPGSSRRGARRCPTSPGSTPPASSAAAAEGRMARPGPARRRPAGRLPRPDAGPAGPRRRRVRGRRRLLPDRVVAAGPTWSCRPPPTPSGPGTFTNLEGRVSRLGQKVTPPGRGLARLDDRRRAGRPRSATTSASTTSTAIWAEIERVSPAHAGV